MKSIENIDFQIYLWYYVVTTSIMFANTKWNYSGRCNTPQACDVAGLYHLQYHEN